jgi:hypothetical protein
VESVQCGGHQKYKKNQYTNAFANLQKQVLRDIFDTVDTFNGVECSFDELLGDFGKSKWQSYSELLRFPLSMDGLKPIILMGKLKQVLPYGVSIDNVLLLSVFLLRLPASMREGVGAFWP